MLYFFIKKIKKLIKNLDKKTLKIIKNGLFFCGSILLISIATLITYLFFVHNYFVYNIGILTFRISLYFAVYFIISGITVDSIKKQLI